MVRNSQPIDILLVEDNPADARLTREAMRDARVNNELHVVVDGLQALAYLRREPPFAEAKLPDLILLDINLPKKNGLEVLAEIKADDHLRRIPVVILTSSQAEQDILATYNRHGNAYIVKPVDLDQFMQVVKTIEGFWLEIVRLPAEGR